VPDACVFFSHFPPGLPILSSSDSLGRRGSFLIVSVRADLFCRSYPQESRVASPPENPSCYTCHPLFSFCPAGWRWLPTLSFCLFSPPFNGKVASRGSFFALILVLFHQDCNIRSESPFFFLSQVSSFRIQPLKEARPPVFILLSSVLLEITPRSDRLSPRLPSWPVSRKDAVAGIY